MKVLYVAYPLLPLSANSAGGAEQVLWTLEREMARRGHSTVVAAANGSHAAGEVFATGATRGVDAFDERCREHHDMIIDRIRRDSFDLVHDHSGWFWREAVRVQVPVLATLHLARRLYDGTFDNVPSNVAFNLVSQSQWSHFADMRAVAGVVENGIVLEEFPFCPDKGDYLLWLGRVCEEKGTHAAIELARQAGMRLVIAGKVYPFRYHLEYFAREVQPHVDGQNVVYIDSPDLSTKVRLLQGARAVVVTSLIEETSSLVSMEAMACGTPVLAFRRGALEEVIGSAGFVGNSAHELAAAAPRVHEIDPRTCRARVEQRYSATAMAAGYERLYEAIARRHLAKLSSAA